VEKTFRLHIAWAVQVETLAVEAIGAGFGDDVMAGPAVQPNSEEKAFERTVIS